MKIEVTQAHIEQGVKSDCSLCPVALAMAESGFDQPHATCRDLSWLGVLVKTPLRVSEWIERFDLGRQVEPFTFEIDA